MSSPANTATVILVHGLSANRLVMWPLQRRLNAEGFRCINWGYRSTTKSCDFHAGQLIDLIQRLISESAPLPIHFVGHSMGCILIRAALQRLRSEVSEQNAESESATVARQLLQQSVGLRPGRIVMLAPPNGGSFVASKLGRGVKWICPTMLELGEAPDSYVNRLGQLEGYEFGIIAAKFDWVIRPSKVRLPGAKDFSIVPCNHGLLPWHRQALEQTARFLKTGSFLK